MTEWITTENIPAEAWRRILEYANLDFSKSAISNLHGSPDNKSLKQNYKKQAQQIRVSILQSKEYFDAASASSLFTSPNHLYYGMVSLASAIMLLIGTGDKALDRLRKDSSNKHHGLNLSTNVNNRTCQDIEKIAKGGVTTTRRQYEGFEILLSSEEIIGKKYSLLDLFARLPDVYPDLARYGHTVPASRLSFEDTRQTDKAGKLEWRIHGAPNPAALELILEKFKSPLDAIDCWECSDYENQTGCIVHFNYNDRDEGVQYPSIRENINNDQIAYEIHLDTLEIIDAYMAAYALSMLSRYYPDYWISCLESHCMAANAIEHFVFVMSKKFPVLALKLLTSSDIVISTHRPPWHG
jgi:hypothetical protein